MSAFVLGFADEAAQLAGLAWSLAGREGALVAIGGVLSDPGAKAAMNGEDIVVEAAVGGRGVVVEAGTGSSHELFADPPPPGDPSAALGTAGVRVTGPDQTIACSANLTTWAEDPSGGSELIRHFSAPVAGEGAIMLIAARPEGATHHAAETVAAWKLDPAEAPTPFVEALLSTQYDEEGRPTRTGLELWPDDPDAPATRAAGTRPLTGASEGVTASLMHTSAEGTSGVGGYLVVRP